LRIDYLPFPTAYCDLCAARTRKGQQPSCVKHCQAIVMQYGTVAELAKVMEKKPHAVLFTPK
jgi:Fe-S-cluster-containing dehydrogenase component